MLPIPGRRQTRFYISVVVIGSHWFWTKKGNSLHFRPPVSGNSCISAFVVVSEMSIADFG